EPVKNNDSLREFIILAEPLWETAKDNDSLREFVILASSLW
ncbi:14302_t:CDS:1, partial [Funneliformis geosporum]